MPSPTALLRMLLLIVAMLLPATVSYAQTTPASETYDLYFAKGISEFELERYEAAEKLFRKALEAKPGDPEATLYLTQIARGRPGKQKIWDLTLSVSAQWDDNVAAVPLGTSPPGGPSGISRQSDYRTVFALRGEVRAFEQGPLVAGAGYSFYQSLHRTLSGFDVEAHTPVVFVQYTAGPVQTRLQYVFDYAQVGRSPYVIAHAFAPIITVTETPELFTQFQLRYQSKDYQDGRFLFNSLRDGHNWLIGGTQYWLYANKTAHVRAGYFYDKEVTGGKNATNGTDFAAADWAYQGHRFLVGATLPPVYRTTLDIGFEYYWQPYNSANSFSILGNVYREDNVYTPYVTATRQLTDQLSLALQYLHMRNESNVAAFDYNRNIFSLTLTGQF